MISHEHKVIFIHIPKCAGTSINEFIHPNLQNEFWKDDYRYKCLFGWCPKLNIHLQHATPKQLLENNLITSDQWNSYFKFAFVRNSWDRAVSDYFWLKNDKKIDDNFSNYIQKTGLFKEVLTDKTQRTYRGDHLTPQYDYVTINDAPCLDFVGDFSNLHKRMKYVAKKIGINKPFREHKNKGVQNKNHYSKFLTKKDRDLITERYQKDIDYFNFTYKEIRPWSEKIRALVKK